jgi:hypothetical protein
VIASFGTSGYGPAQNGRASACKTSPLVLSSANATTDSGPHPQAARKQDGLSRRRHEQPRRAIAVPRGQAPTSAGISPALTSLTRPREPAAAIAAARGRDIGYAHTQIHFGAVSCASATSSMRCALAARDRGDRVAGSPRTPNAGSRALHDDLRRVDERGLLTLHLFTLPRGEGWVGETRSTRACPNSRRSSISSVAARVDLAVAIAGGQLSQPSDV